METRRAAPLMRSLAAIEFTLIADRGVAEAWWAIAGKLLSIRVIGGGRGFEI